MEDRTKRALQILEEWGLIAACGLSLVLSVLYFWPPPFIVGDAKEFLRALATNVIPVLLMFATSYLVLRKAQAIRAEIDRQELVEAVSAKTKGVLVDQFDAIALKVESTSQLVRDWDEKGVERASAQSPKPAQSARRNSK